MIIFAIFGICVNAGAAFFTREKGSLNQKAVNLHMLEDVLGWAVVLVGSIIMHFTDFALIDPIMSICVSVFIFVNAIKNLKSAIDLFLQKTPKGIEVNEIKEHIMNIDGIIDVHHIHIWSIDEHNNYATMHIVTESEPAEIKHSVRDELLECGIVHTTLELEAPNEHCEAQHCHIEHHNHTGCGHHHH
jgi:cobalt-zinc-cadmium efflux system protein